ncbi:hypothetical protein [Brasilonema bromeliae]|uniref:Uncharacterized protein n=1 Tax=Brasilonema bromeliae SPC951 TaxID=385972 RepID=A0ABX1P7T9_9CYAN|nr:hypothetical protein [Brasilonema bromeliae SPC951]
MEFPQSGTKGETSALGRGASAVLGSQCVGRLCRLVAPGVSPQVEHLAFSRQQATGVCLRHALWAKAVRRALCAYPEGSRVQVNSQKSWTFDF